ncbi:PREDICTED: venom allergen 5-like [Nicrophorus vespilloides]|uniref:Venom allergen 5-like n=1 Tax=Nicrophorus vespilloides TaxID=110193 RepID=A0ABM1N9Z5_NICVS|nr:PREDICTED: venom allergen 5-like [Nicrophorus vespilloides]
MFGPVFIAALVAIAASENCPSGGEIFARGITEEGKIQVIKAHNDYRLEIANGRLANQPRAVNMKKMVYDQGIGEKGKVVSDSCTMHHIIAEDDRFNWIGQNLYMMRSSEKDDEGQDWNRAVASWFIENKDFTYPNITAENKVTGHYTQVAWADSKNVGCDYIYFYDNTTPITPYSKLYTCNYGPGGNYIGVAPYETGTSGCENLC